MGSYGGAGQGGASCLHLATPKAPGVSGCRAPLGLGAGDAGRAAGAGKFSVCRAKAKRREKGPETLLVKEGGCRPGRDSGTAPGRDAPSGHCPAPSRPPALLGHAQATHRPRPPLTARGASPASPLSCHERVRLLLPSCRAVSPPPTLLVPYFPCSPSLSPADFCAPRGSGGCVSRGQRGPDPSEGAGGWRANERPRGRRERVRRRKPQISSALSHAGWELDPWPPGWGALLALPGELDAEPSTRAAGGHWRPPYCTKGRGVVSRTSCQSRVEPASRSGPVRKAGAVVAVCQPTGLVPSGWVGLLARHA